MVVTRTNLACYLLQCCTFNSWQVFFAAVKVGDLTCRAAARCEPGGMGVTNLTFLPAAVLHCLIALIGSSA